MVNFKPLIIKFFRENNTKKSMTFDEVSFWYIKQNDFNYYPPYLSLWRTIIKSYSMYDSNTKIYYFYWDLILKDLRVKYKGVEKIEP